MTTGAVKCWGSNANGQLGDGTTTKRLTPVQVSGLTFGVVAIAASGGATTCALLSTGAVKCWGANTHGEVGDGTQTDRLVPTQVSGRLTMRGITPPSAARSRAYQNAIIGSSASRLERTLQLAGVRPFTAGNDTIVTSSLVRSMANVPGALTPDLSCVLNDGFSSKLQ